MDTMSMLNSKMMLIREAIRVHVSGHGYKIM